jgi:hypothetical protein
LSNSKEKSSQIAWKIVPLRNSFPLKVVPLIEVLLYAYIYDDIYMYIPHGTRSAYHRALSETINVSDVGIGWILVSVLCKVFLDSQNGMTRIPCSSTETMPYIDLNTPHKGRGSVAELTRHLQGSTPYGITKLTGRRRPRMSLGRILPL